jgi:hypothetical protein
MAYATFTDALMQAKRASQLRGQPFSTADTSNLQSSYMSGAAERAAGGRAAALSEKTLVNQKRNFAETLAQEKSLADAKLTQDKGLAETTLTQTKTLSDADLLQKKELSDANLLQQKTLTDTTLANTKQLAADKIAADKVLADAKIKADADAQAIALAQAKELEDAKTALDQKLAADKIAADKIISDNEIQAKKDEQIAILTQEKELTGLSNDQAKWLATAQIDAQEKAGDKALWGNIATTALMIGGAWLTMPDKTPPKETPTFENFYKMAPTTPTTPTLEPPPVAEDKPEPATLEPPPTEATPDEVVIGYQEDEWGDPDYNLPIYGPAPATLEPPSTPAPAEPEVATPTAPEPKYIWDHNADNGDGAEVLNPNWTPSAADAPPAPSSPPPEKPPTYLEWKVALDQAALKAGKSWQQYRSEFPDAKAEWEASVEAYNNFDWDGYKAYYDYQNAGFGDVGPTGGGGGGGTADPSAPAFYQSEDYEAPAPAFYQAEDYWGGSTGSGDSYW